MSGKDNRGRGASSSHEYPGAYRSPSPDGGTADYVDLTAEAESLLGVDTAKHAPKPKTIPWIRRIPKAGRLIGMSTLVCIIGVLLLIAGLAYIDGIKSGSEGSSGLISAALQAITEYSGDRAFNGNERMNILCLGIDYNRDSKGIEYTKGARSDTMFVVSIDPKGETLNVVSIPRDCYVYLGDEYGYDKINAAYMYGGVELSKKVVSEFLGVPIHHYVIIKVYGASQLVDALGGLIVDVEKDMDYDDNWGKLHIHLKAGEQLLKGDQAVGYARFRMDAESDRGRIRRQQQVMAAVLKRIKDPMVVMRLQSIVKAVKQNLDTDLSLLDMLDLTYLYKDFDRRRMKTGVIVGDDADINGASVVMPYGPMNEKTVLELLKDPSKIQRSDVRVEVLNGSGREGLEGTVAEYLTGEGFRVVHVGVADTLCDMTIIKDHIDSSSMRNILQNALVGCVSEVDLLPPDKRKADITVIIGADRADCGYGSHTSAYGGSSESSAPAAAVPQAEPAPYEGTDSSYGGSGSSGSQYSGGEGGGYGSSASGASEPPAAEPPAPAEPAPAVPEAPPAAEPVPEAAEPAPAAPEVPAAAPADDYAAPAPEPVDIGGGEGADAGGEG